MEKCVMIKFPDCVVLHDTGVGTVPNKQNFAPTAKRCPALSINVLNLESAGRRRTSSRKKKKDGSVSVRPSALPRQEKFRIYGIISVYTCLHVDEVLCTGTV